MSAPNTPSLIEAYDAIKSIATQNPNKLTLGELRHSQPPGSGLHQGEMMRAHFGILLGAEPYGTSLNLHEKPDATLNINIIEWGQAPLKNALGAGVRPQAILDLIKKLTPTIDPDNPPKAKLLIEKLISIQSRLRREARQATKKDLQDGSLCA